MRWSCLVLLGLAAAVTGRADELANKPVLALDADGHTARVNHVLFTPDGRELITTSDDKTIRFWDVATGESLRTLRPPAGPGPEGMLYAAALAPDGRTLAVGGFGSPADKWGTIFLITLPARPHRARAQGARRGDPNPGLLPRRQAPGLGQFRPHRPRLGRG
jgi:hypothetical protein